MTATNVPAHAPAPQPPSKQSQVKALIERAMPAIRAVIPKHVTPERLAKVVLGAINRTPALLDCSQSSLLLAVLQAAELGLEPGSALGEAYLIPYGKQVQMIVGYRGLVALARRSGQIKSLESRVVYQRDEFSVEHGTHPRLTHKPCLNGDPGPLVLVYAIARLTDGAEQVEVMTKTQVDAIRSRSRAAKTGPWVTDYDEMARKTVVRRLAKYLPLSVEMARAIENDARTEAGEPPLTTEGELLIDATVPPEEQEPPQQQEATKSSGAEALKAKLANE